MCVCVCVCVCVIVRDRVCVHSNYQQLCDCSEFNEGRLWSLLMMWIIKIKKILIKTIISLLYFLAFWSPWFPISLDTKKAVHLDDLFINFLLTLMNLNPVYFNFHINLLYYTSKQIHYFEYPTLRFSPV